MIKTAVFLTTIVLSMTACNGNQYLQKNSTHNQEEIIFVEQEIVGEDIPVDLLKMIENERQKSRPLNNNSDSVTYRFSEGESTIDDISGDGVEISEIEPVNITEDLIYSGEGQFRSQSPINGIYKDVYEYDLPPKQNSYSHRLFPWDNIFEYGIPISSIDDN
ncbi:hypothetical protein Cyast_1218 [Cyanobacterium stanieri PCC 7202]|uniref:Lipoprotein n=1 Tax=Cyanobacterium stanieri (strain ATCC 29140 / PCC 7202) TaxID=292563 RepID=K9YM75_CYASC|nr:hypothetical protein Cyast_1218 [Cyanobacterium stanieri PCC 7202]